MPTPRRPRLHAHLAPQQIGPGLVQLGSEPDSAILLHGVTEAEAALLPLLDGRLDVLATQEHPENLQVRPERLSQLMGQLDRAGAFLPEDRAQAATDAVAVLGDEHLVDPLADVLTRCGAAVVTAARADAVVVVSHLSAGHLATHHDLPVLPVLVGQRSIVIGPLFPEQPAQDDPCPACLPGPGPMPLDRPPLPPARALLAAGALLTSHLHAYLSGESVPVGATHELDLATLAMTRRLWTRSPSCPRCGVRRRPGRRPSRRTLSDSPA